MTIIIALYNLKLLPIHYTDFSISSNCGSENYLSFLNKSDHDQNAPNAMKIFMQAC